MTMMWRMIVVAVHITHTIFASSQQKDELKVGEKENQMMGERIKGRHKEWQKRMRGYHLLRLIHWKRKTGTRLTRDKNTRRAAKGREPSPPPDDHCDDCSVRV